MDEPYTRPRWARDFRRFLPLRSQFVFSGNVRDRYPRPGPEGALGLLPLVPYLAAELFEAGIEQIVAYDPARGFWLPPVLGATPNVNQKHFAQFGIEFDPGGRAQTSIEKFFETAGAIASAPGEPTAVIIDFASRLIARPDHLIDLEQRGFTRALVAAHSVEPQPHPRTRAPTFNPLVWIVEKEGDLPDWFMINNPRLRHVPVPKPDHIARRAVVQGLLRPLSQPQGLDANTLAKAEDTLVEGTEGLLVVDLAGIFQLARAEGLGARDPTEAIRRYKLGVTEDAWRKIDRKKLTNAEAFVSTRVKGQPHAIQHMLDIVKRAATGVAGRRGGRPRGVVFLAGPTGVGKTELAKTITSLLFGDESAYIRFDMSEFSAEHADQRLIGAPPGYVGYDTGGELTNAIRERPFSVVLFDEIEKAHPRILDKFLQVLDDGVLTSGRGERVYFSESLIIFTSNLGTTKLGADGVRSSQLSAEDTFETIRSKVRAEIEKHFKIDIGRPELLNRIGENIIVFDFIRANTAREILKTMVSQVIRDLHLEQGVEITLSQEAQSQLEELCLSDLSNGGRGIRNQVEAHFINPLARALFDLTTEAGSSWDVEGVEAARSATSLRLKARSQ
jgi:hypothetical protein